MLRRRLTYLFVILIVLQSLSAVADSHQYHQTDNSHFTSTYEHDAEKHAQPSNAAATEADCQHCCHCHGLAQVYVTHQPGRFITTERLNSHARYICGYSSVFAAPDNPPPIA
ncbi:hypothetical protein [Teredinibacter franksiae]|uniref:hypothetical protein n=1 Tax=Teredinibacter franksiae TaxID=2761453 RepID=UPI0016245017|nr:hypothetical protein [Teredinibacter franksiae]